MNPDISIVIPAYNEAKRLKSFLSRLISYCKIQKRIYEIIVVDDGSSDNTFEVSESFRQEFSNLHTIKIKGNRGKGYAVKAGFLKATGNLRLFLDADGSVGPEEIERNIRYILDEGYDIFIGSRVLKDEKQSLDIRWYRKIIGTIFNFLVQAFLFKKIKDTQCGFKIFKKDVVVPLFSRSYLEGFGFDIEILYLAYKMGYRVKEAPVSWHHAKGSKIDLFTDSVKMFFNILQVRNWHCTPINPSSKYFGPDEYKYMYELENYHWWFVSRRNLIEHIIRSLNFQTPAILDVGSGTGGNLLLLNKMGKAYGIDISKQAVEFCQKRGLNDVALSPIEKIPHKDKAFDMVVCTDVLEHVPDPIKALEEIKRVLKDNGKIIVTVPAFRILWSQHDDALCHLRRYEKHSLLNDVTEAGLKVEKMGYFFFISFFAVFPIRIMRRFFAGKTKARSDTTTLPPKPLNEFLKFLFKIEIRIADKVRLPFGTSLYTIISKKDMDNS